MVVHIQFLIDRWVSQEAVSNDADQSMLKRHRTKIFLTKFNMLKSNGKESSPEYLGVFSDNPLYGMVWVECSTEKLIPEATFTSEFRHRLLIFVTLVSLALKQSLDAEVNVTWDGNVEYSKSLLLPSARQLSTVNPAYAQTVIRRVSAEFLTTFQPHSCKNRR